MTSDTLDNVEVLLVEDTSEDAELTIRTLKRHGLANHMMWVKDGAAALDFLFGTGAYVGRDKTNMPRVILLDLHLPKLSGLEVLRHLKADPLTHQIPVVVLTSSTEESDMRRCYGLGVNSFVSKPVEFEAFVKVVGKMGFYWLLVNKLPGL
ncbi:response regulator [Rhodoferax sp.]|uniref:response regulator n=1 Tax=Rhodoferax sp. TaxID=50421 RepID=UPI0008BC5164|nr:response regulator [Rhodoferax sp.]MDO8319975.1 response regulator [Rhodoferax sp.]MDP2678161.1 response regulator [Rhodoferax sp.]OGB77004.1 MAG: two-component system response regulator [Burkholderiales bacterium RIFOXYC12_FULL_60_6]